MKAAGMMMVMMITILQRDSSDLRNKFLNVTAKHFKGMTVKASGEPANKIPERVPGSATSFFRCSTTPFQLLVANLQKLASSYLGKREWVLACEISD